LIFSRGISRMLFSEIVRGVKLDEQKVKRLVVYATDRSLVYVMDSSPEMDVTKEKFRLSGEGIDQLNEWGDKGPLLMI